VETGVECVLQQATFENVHVRTSILFLKNGLKKIASKIKKKKTKTKTRLQNNFRSNNYEVCTAVARGFPNSF
jgi:hypothetical protein